MPTFEELLQKSASYHDHLCPRQVLGVRMGLAGGRRLGLELHDCHRKGRAGGIVSRDLGRAVRRLERGFLP